jgi:glycosyltransferase involved in cell wall biosynthesis
MSALRILVLAPGGNPDSLSTSLVTYAHSEALARLNSVTMVTGAGHEEAIRRQGTAFQAVEIIALPWLDRIYAWCLRRIFKFNYGSLALTAFGYPFILAFEFNAWRRLRTRIGAGDFDVVLRVSPITSVLPSPFAYFLRKGPVPFVIGPINGGLPWPKGFSQAERQRQRDRIAGLRNCYRFLPFARSTYRYATAIIAGSSQTYHEFSTYREKMFFVPENGLNQSLLANTERTAPRDDKLELIYVGRLVPYKGCDMALRAVAPLLHRDAARFTILGDGPDRPALEALSRSLGIERRVSFRGMLSHADTIRCLRESDVLVYPAIREFGGGVVFEALAVGVVPVVVDFGGPGDIVNSEVGFKVPLTNEADVVKQIQNALERLLADRNLVAQLRKHGMSYARENLSWDGKAKAVTEILRWAVQKGPKPNLPPPKMFCPAGTAPSRA